MKKVMFCAMLLLVAMACKKEETVSQQNQENGHEFVDLGLSVKWASCNVGATSPEGYGDFFAWGETSPHYSMDWNNWEIYQHCEGSSTTMTKYCTNSRWGTVDNKTTLELCDDAAQAKWGGAWRIPTAEEQEELQNQCTWEWTTQNGVNGYKVTGKNGNSIFLPAAGFRDETGRHGIGEYGYYWSSSLFDDNSNCAYSHNFYSKEVNWVDDYRYLGHSIRPVCPKN